MSEDLQAIGEVSKFGTSVIKAITAFTDPYTTRRQTRADCERIVAVAEAEAKAKLISTVADAEAARVMVQMRDRIIGREVWRQLNINAVFAKTLEYKPTPEDEANSRPPKADWMSGYVDGCQDVSDEEMQGWWARLLAKQVVKPGAFSRRTVSLCRDMERSDLIAFERLASIAWRREVGNAIAPVMNTIPNEHYLTVQEVHRLTSAGLLQGVQCLEIQEGTVFTIGPHRLTTRCHICLESQILTHSGTELLKLTTGVDEEHFARLYPTIGGDSRFAKE
jgi:hypothetical protein